MIDGARQGQQANGHHTYPASEVSRWSYMGTIADRMAELRLTISQLAEKAQLHPGTVRRLVRGEGRSNEATRNALAGALGWPRDEFDRRTRIGLDPAEDRARA